MKRKGFTLAELLMVVVIIGILATIMYPNFQGFRLRAQLKEVENTVQLIRAAEKYYFFKSASPPSYYTWDKTEANNDYSTAEPILNIDIPSINNAMCRYRVEVSGSQTWIVFYSNDVADEDQGRYVLDTDTYVIDSYDGQWENYLLYLE